MLFLSDASLVVFLKFLEILLWIAIPALFIAMLITTVVHYSRKANKKRSRGKNEETILIGFDDLSLVPDLSALPGNRHEVKKFMQHISRSNARYIAIRKDFETLTRKYQRLHLNIQQDLKIIKNETMETIQTDTQQNPYEQIENIRQQHEAEKEQLHAELSQLNKAYENLEKDNAGLHEQLSAYSNDDTKVSGVIQKWEQEKAELRRKITEQEYLKDVLEEKKLQITFLQQQLEQRVKNHHLVEQQFRELGIKFMEVKEELEIKQQTEKEFQTIAHDKEQEIAFLKEVIQSKSDHADQLENSLKALEDQNRNFSLVTEDNSKLIESLREQLANNNEQKNELERKLERNNTLLKGFHRKISDVFEEDLTEPPVIVMKHIYTENPEQLTESAIQ